jgi:hypothetical protein
MSRKKTGWQESSGRAGPRRLAIIIAVAALLSLIGAWTMLAHSGAFHSAFSRKRKSEHTVSLASLNSNSSPSKEMIYAGTRLITTEEPCSNVDTQPPAFANGCLPTGVAPASQCPYAHQRSS